MNEITSGFLLGIVQGITEFLPISSDGHLALFQLIFRTEAAGLTLNVLLHIGTFFATILVLRERFGLAFTTGLRAVVRPRLFVETSPGQDALFVVVASIPTAIIGLLLRDPVEWMTTSPYAIGIGFFVTATVLLSTVWSREGGVEHPGLRAAVLVGIAQGAAVLPGVSRSACTIATLLFLGVARGRAFELSMLMSLPAVLGAVLLEGSHAFAAGGSFVPAIVGATTAFFTGIVALSVLRRVVTSGGFPWFAAWVGPLAIATLAMARVWP